MQTSATGKIRMLYKNHVILMGKVIGDVKSKELKNGSSLTVVDILTKTNYTDKEGNKHSKNCTHRVKMYGAKAEFASSTLGDGSYVYVEGELEAHVYPDEREVVEIRCHSFTNLAHHKVQEG